MKDWRTRFIRAETSAEAASTIIVTSTEVWRVRYLWKFRQGTMLLVEVFQVPYL